MDELLVTTLRSRLKRLIEAIKAARELLEEIERGVDQQTLLTKRIDLANKLGHLNNDLEKYVARATNPNKELHLECHEQQVQAEDLLTQFEIILKINTEQQNLQGKTKLPKLDLFKFNGDILKWNSFWDRFVANVEKKNIAEVEKMSYLVGSLEGPALQAIEGLETTNQNYPIAVEILKERFGKTNNVIDAHNKALQNLERARTTSECRKTINAIDAHLRILSSYGESIEASHLRVIILDKFPENILYQVKLMTTDEETTSNLRRALDKVITAAEQICIQPPPLAPSFVPVTPTEASTSTLLKVSKERPAKRKRISDRSFKAKRPKISCIFCSKNGHYSEDCENFKTYKERMGRLQQRCFICFKNGHRAAKCFNKKKCPHCSKQHNRALCPLKTKKGETEPVPSAQVVETSVNKSISNRLCNFLQTAVAQIAGQHRRLMCRILMDSGSMRSYITDKLAEDLNLKPDRQVDLVIYTFGSTKPHTVKSPSAEVSILTKRQVEKKIRVNIVPHITDCVPVVKIQHPEIDIIADDASIGQRVDLLIGNDLYFSFIRNNLLKIADDLYMIDSDFGWLFGGFNETSNDNNNSADVLSVVTYCNCHDANCPYFNEPDLPLRNIDMKFLWALESIGITDSPKTTLEEEAVHHFNENIKYSEGRYQVKWPWVQYPPELPTNYGLALGRLKSLLKRSDEDTLNRYNEILKQQLKAKVIETVEPSSLHEISHPIHFLPHHMVKQKGKRGGRIVYDASSKIKDEKSLNECLYRGPSMLEDLTGLIFNFRMGTIGITADVEKAFLQVGLQPEDRDVTRFLWIKDPLKEVTEDNIIQYRFCRVPFGIISSPFLLTATIRYHILKTEKALLSKIADRCYVDNLVTSADSSEEALQLYKDTNRVFHDLGMNIRDWMSNDKNFIEKIPLSQRDERMDKMKILGLLWNIKNDTLQLNVDSDIFSTNYRGITKKGVLKVLARLYDPCGFASPLILPGKLLFQELCAKKMKWEDTLPDDMQRLWENIVSNLAAIRDIEVPRYVGSDHKQTEDIVQYELHGYTDASMNSYATVVYLRVIGKQKTSVTFLMSKSRITPMEDKNDLKIPRLELLGFLIGSRLVKYIYDHIKVKPSKLCLWTDSQVVLAWMKTSKLLPPFVARRVNEIKQTCRTLGIELCYVNTKDNPADIATRPELWQKKQHLWFQGPEFLAQDEKYWPKSAPINEELCLVGRALDIVDGPEMMSKGYESEVPTPIYEEQELIRQLNVESPNINDTTENVLSIDNIKKIQKEYFPDEVQGKKTNLSLNLGLFKDEDGILRSKGRLGHANLPYEKKYPIVVPKHSSLTTQIIKRAHEENYHVGVPHTLNIIRQKYWIPQGRAQVQKIIRNCPQCVKHGGGPFQLPPAPALPSERVNYSSPFHFTGLDYLGPILVATDKGKEKRWICLLTCLAVRALHLELVEDLSAKECLLAIRRFTATRGIPNTIISDNALQFKLTSEILKSDYCVNRGIKWKFITQLAPWQGGFYERLVALVKHCLKRTLDKHLLTESQMVTVLKEVESVLNTRPLTAVGAEPEEVLKPADFLTLGQCLDLNMDLLTPDQQLTSTKVDLIQSWKRGQMILEEYKKMFINQYLPSLRERSFHTHRQPRVKSGKLPEIGDIVQIRDDCKNRTNWKVGKIISLIKGHDNVVRVAKVKVNNTEFTRSVGHLYPLEADSVEETHTSGTELTKTVNLEEQIGTEEDISDSTETNEVLAPDISFSSMPPTEQVDDSSHPKVVPYEGSLQIQEDQSIPLEGNAPLEDLIEQPAIQNAVDLPAIQNPNMNGKRDAAIKAREKIAEWTRHLLTVL